MTLAELRRAVELLPPGTALTLPRETLLEALNGAEPPDTGIADAGARLARLLSAAEVAERLGTSVRWVYDHADQLGRCQLSRRCLRFPEAAVRRYLERRR